MKLILLVIKLAELALQTSALTLPFSSPPMPFPSLPEDFLSSFDATPEIPRTAALLPPQLDASSGQSSIKDNQEEILTQLELEIIKLISEEKDACSSCGQVRNMLHYQLEIS